MFTSLKWAFQDDWKNTLRVRFNWSLHLCVFVSPVKDTVTENKKTSHVPRDVWFGFVLFFFYIFTQGLIQQLCTAFLQEQIKLSLCQVAFKPVLGGFGSICGNNIWGSDKIKHLCTAFKCAASTDGNVKVRKSHSTWIKQPGLYWDLWSCNGPQLQWGGIWSQHKHVQ